MTLLTRRPTATVTFPTGVTFSTTDHHAPTWGEQCPGTGSRGRDQ